jgi:hypothetical protein
MNLLRARAIFGVNREDIPAVTLRAQSIYTGFSGDEATYASPPVALPALQILIQNVISAQLVVPSGLKGAAAKRDVQRDLLMSAMESERVFVQLLADASPSRAVALILNAGLLVAGFGGHPKALLTLTNGVQPGTVNCDANVGLLVGAGASKPHQNRFFAWQTTVDGGKTFVSAPSTSRGKTTLVNLPSLTLVGVRVQLNNSDGPGAWSQVVTIIVH